MRAAYPQRRICRAGKRRKAVRHPARAQSAMIRTQAPRRKAYRIVFFIAKFLMPVYMPKYTAL